LVLLPLSGRNKYEEGDSFREGREEEEKAHFSFAIAVGCRKVRGRRKGEGRPLTERGKGKTRQFRVAIVLVDERRRGEEGGDEAPGGKKEKKERENEVCIDLLDAGGSSKSVAFERKGGKKGRGKILDRGGKGRGEGEMSTLSTTQLIPYKSYIE